MRRAVIRLGTLAVRVGFAVGRWRPVRAHVVLASLRATDVTGNLLYIRRELERRTPPIPVRIVVCRMERGLGGRIRGAWQAARAGYHLATARVFVVDDWYFPMYVITPRPGTLRVQTWHAAGALKKIGYSVLDKSFGTDELMASLVDIHSNYTLCLMPSEATTAHYMEAFRQPRERFTSALGLPRTDLFFDAAHRAQAGAAVRRCYDLPRDRKVLLYAPTFRGDTITAARYDDHLELTVLRDALAPDWIVLMRLHPFVRRGLTISPDLAGFAIDASDWPDINELMLVADLLVTDYSSAIFEFALLERPMAFLAPDHEAYERERGFYVDYRTSVPGPVFETTAELAAWVREGRFDPLRVRAFARASFDVADGHASERFVDQVVIPALRGEPLRIEPRLTARAGRES